MAEDTESPKQFEPKDDLVEDRAIRDAGNDYFGHAEFAAQAARTIQAIETPANIAIYAPWGSGKTSLAYLLEKELKSDSCAFVYFDAFKYAEAPLRREFIRQVAKKLNVTDTKFDRGLYEEESRSGLNLEKTTLRDLGFMVGVVAAGALILAALVSLALAWTSHKAIGPAWAANAKVLIPAIFSPTVLVAPLAALVGVQLNVNRKRYAPQSDEEFERLFRELIDEVRRKEKGWRLVVFIDELDRCQAAEVASTLETLRTFLEVPDCVFVVAADRAVLETAVAKQSRQETPFNHRNPYYSAGSSYLDKIFQYQWQLLPMMSSSLARFAESLVNGKKGLWSEINAGEVVSVLVPLHVQSPRRVKELLNAFAMAYRIAERRIADHHLDGDLKQRAAELAKLVCLQLEFPVFANDLPNEPRFPELVLDLADNPETDCLAGIAEDVWERAISYAAGRVQLDVVLAGDSDGLGHDLGDSNLPATPEQQVVAAQGHLLLRYLQKTRRIPGPDADLIFMESPGFAFGLPAALATRLKEDATEGAVSHVTAAIAPLPPNQQLAALQLLGSHVREALPGVEGTNALRAMLRAVGELPGLDISEIVNELADAATSAMGNDQNLAPEDVVGAIKLGLSTSRPIGRDLVSHALDHDTILSDPATAAFVAANANDFSSDHLPRIAEVVASLLVDLPWVGGGQVILDWRDKRAVDLLEAVEGQLHERIEGAREVREAQPQTSPHAALGVLQPSPEGHEEVPSPEETAIDRLLELIAPVREAERKDVLEVLLLLILSIDVPYACETVVSELPQLGVIKSLKLTERVLTVCAKRANSEKPTWLDSVDIEVFKNLSRPKTKLETVAKNIWIAEDLEKPPKLLEAEAAFTSVKRLADAIDWNPAMQLVDAVLANAALPTMDQPHVTLWRARIRLVLALEERDLILPLSWRSEYVGAAVKLANAEVPDDPTRALVRMTLLDDSSDLASKSSSESAKLLFDAIKEAPCLSFSDCCLAQVRIFAGRGGEEEILQVDPQDLLSAFNEEPDSENREVLAEAIGTWLRDCKPLIADAWMVLDGYVDERLPEALESGLREYASHLSADDGNELVRLALNEFPNRMVSEAMLGAMQFHDGDLSSKVELLIQLADRAKNEEHRRGILRIWRALRLTNSGLTGRLLDEVMVPMVHQNKTNRELVLANLHLVQNASDPDKGRLSRAFMESAGAESGEWSAAAQRLVKAGVMRRAGNIFTGYRPEHLH